MPSPKTKAAPKSTKAPSKKVDTMPASVDELNPDSIAFRQAVREDALSAEDTRSFHPLDLSLVLPLCDDDYRPIAEKAIETGEEKTIRIRLEDAFDFLKAWMKANGANRNPKPAHYAFLSQRFAEEFVSSATHWVVANNGMITNAGHSGIAFARAYYPETIFYGVTGSPHKVEKEMVLADSDAGRALLEDEYFFVGKVAAQDATEQFPVGTEVVFASFIPPRPEGVEGAGEYDENGKWIPDTDSPEKRAGLEATLVLNAPPESCLKMDDVRLQADYADFLEMVGSLRAYLPTLPGHLDNATLGAIFLNWYKRVNHSVKGETVTFGSVGKGGRPTKSDVQIWAVMAMPMLRRSLELLQAEGQPHLAAWPVWSKKKDTEKGGINLLNGLVAMMVSDDKGRQRIADLLQKPVPGNWKELPEQMRKFRNAVIVPNEPGKTPIGADTIVQALILYGMGKEEWYTIATKMVKVGDKEVNPWQHADNRAAGWDANHPDVLEGGVEDYAETQEETAKTLAGILGDASVVDSVSRKATRKGKGKRGPNAKK